MWYRDAITRPNEIENYVSAIGIFGRACERFVSDVGLSTGVLLFA